MGQDIIRIRDLDEDSPIKIDTGEQVIEITCAEAKRWLSTDAPSGELMRFLLVCRALKLNPFVGEIMLAKHESKSGGGTRYSVIVEKAGYLRLAQSHPDYDGFEAGIIVVPHDKETGEESAYSNMLSGTALPGGHLLRGGWATVHRKNVKHPTHITVDIQEYSTGKSTWASIPRTMIRKVALVQALRESGLIHGGWYVREEMRDLLDDPPQLIPAEPMNGSLPPAVMEAIEVESEAVPDTALPVETSAVIIRLIDRIGLDTETVAAALTKKYGVDSPYELSTMQAAEFIRKLEELASEDDMIGGAAEAEGDAEGEGEATRGELSAHQDTIDAILAAATQLGIDSESLSRGINVSYGVRLVQDLTQEQAENFLAELETAAHDEAIQEAGGATQEEASDHRLTRSEMIDAILLLADRLGMDDEVILDSIRVNFGISSIRELDREQAAKFLSRLEEIERSQVAQTAGEAIEGPDSEPEPAAFPNAKIPLATRTTSPARPEKQPRRSRKKETASA